RPCRSLNNFVPSKATTSVNRTGFVFLRDFHRAKIPKPPVFVGGFLFCFRDHAFLVFCPALSGFALLEGAG
ncbi:hypothetical protein, partial [Parvibaculum sp.]|uniref:hypothetical protein n=1 Tax=Parvibaculum sp. TaxID=2024848 RepID=UPI0025F00396